jgi:hypothetical protein
MMFTLENTTRITQTVVMSGFMSMALSGVFSWLEFGFTTAWVAVWVKSIVIAWPVAFTLDVIFGSHLRNLVLGWARIIHRTIAKFT